MENINPIHETGINKNIYSKTFLWMFLGLFATGIVSVFTCMSGFTQNYVYLWPVFAIVEVIVVILFSFLNRKLPPSVVSALFFIYAILNGVTLSVIFEIYELRSIIILFFASAAVFGISALVGYFTKKDLSKIGTILMITLIVGILVSIINIFIGNGIIDIAVDWAILLVFLGITAWDMQKVRNLAQSGASQDEKVAINCAMELYLDFINIFIRILSIFGNRRD